MVEIWSLYGETVRIKNLIDGKDILSTRALSMIQCGGQGMEISVGIEYTERVRDD